MNTGRCSAMDNLLCLKCSQHCDRLSELGQGHQLNNNKHCWVNHFITSSSSFTFCKFPRYFKHWRNYETFLLSRNLISWPWHLTLTKIWKYIPPSTLASTTNREKFTLQKINTTDKILLSNFYYKACQSCPGGVQADTRSNTLSRHCET